MYVLFVLEGRGKTCVAFFSVSQCQMNSVIISKNDIRKLGKSMQACGECGRLPVGGGGKGKRCVKIVGC